VTHTRAQLAAQLSHRLDDLDVVALFIDGVHVAGQVLVVTLGVTATGTKVPLGLRLGSTENAVVSTELLLQDLSRAGCGSRGRFSV
jgi:transposase-like protein